MNNMRYLYSEGPTYIEALENELIKLSKGQIPTTHQTGSYKLQERPLTEEDIWNGVDRNIVCFDDDAKPGELTDRLLNIMKDVAFDNQDCHNPYTGYHFWVGDICNVNMTGYSEYHGEHYDITVDKRLGLDGELVKYFLNECKATMVKNDTSLVVMFLNNGEVLLGSY